MSEDDRPSEKKEQGDVITKMHVSLSVDLYERALVICQRRNCTLEAVVEDLMERFLPATQLEIEKKVDVRPQRILVEARSMEGKKTERPKGAKRFRW